MRLTILITLICAIFACFGYVQAACPDRDPLGVTNPGFLEKVGCTLEKAWDGTTDVVKDSFNYVKNGFKSDDEKLKDDIIAVIPKIEITEKPWYEKIFK